MSGRVVHALDVVLDPLAGLDVVDGSPEAGLLSLGQVAGADVGIWSLTPGTVRDVEADEVFVVLEGDATVRFEDGECVDLRPGTVVRLRAGERTEWEVRSTLRKVYVSG